jgi:hypothetical protein
MRHSNVKAKRKDKPSNGMHVTRVYKPMARSRITNGHGLLPNVDGRTFWIRRLRDLLALHTQDLGGDDNISEAERAILRRAATLIVELERMEMLFAQAGEATPNQLETYQRVSNTLRRLLESVGLQRRARDVTPDPLEYAKRRRPTLLKEEAAS